MPLQSQNLVMIGLGVSDDHSKLAKGIHLRWSFKRDRGFPWYGYYLFRRLHRTTDKRFHCLVPVIRGLGLRPDTLDTTFITPIGRFVSDSNIVLINEFPPLNIIEFDLSDREYLRFQLPLGNPAYHARVTIGFRGREESEIEIRALVKGISVITKKIRGRLGQVTTTTLFFDMITAIEFSGGNAAVIDICVAPISLALQDEENRWKLVRDFPSPLSLPVAHTEYPCSTKPGTFTNAEEDAIRRIHYGENPDRWRDDNFKDLHELLTELVVGGPPPNGQPMSERSAQNVPGVPVTDDGKRNPVMPHRRPLDYVVLASLNPAIAQMVGLYWIDETAANDESYDYIILADHNNRFVGKTQKALDWLNNANVDSFSDVDGFIVFNMKLDSGTQSLKPPDDLKVYALPGGVWTDAGEEPGNKPNNAGLKWDLGKKSGYLVPRGSVLYHLWRADLGTDHPQDDNLPPEEHYRCITKDLPLLIVEPKTPLDPAPEFPDDWPHFPLHAIDSRLSDGWYSYKVSGVDIFGRHSETSKPSRWFEHDAIDEKHPYAIQLLDKIAPPPPIAIEAYALDPKDPNLVRDIAYNAWQKTLTQEDRDSIVGLRVRWQWPVTYVQQAPDAKEFRIYYQPDSLNVILGNITSVGAPNRTMKIWVETDIPNGHPANAFKDTRLRVRSNLFRVIGSSAGPKIRLLVANIGVDKDIRPEEHAPCTVVIPEKNAAGEPHNLYVDYDRSTNWKERYHVVDYDADVSVRIPAHRIAKNGPSGIDATVSESTVLLTGDLDLSSICIGRDYVYLENDAAREDKLYLIQGISTVTNAVTNITTTNLEVDAPPNLTFGPSPWTIGPDIPSHQYGELLLGSSATKNGSTVSLGGEFDTSVVCIGRDYVYLENDTARDDKLYCIENIEYSKDPDTGEITNTHLTIDGRPNLSRSPSPWIIGPKIPLRQYEVFIPLKDGDLLPNREEPIAYAQIGISTADSKTHTLDAPKWSRGSWRNRKGNEGRVGGKVTIYRVLRERPGSPKPPPDSPEVLASPADYNGHSSYTYRWQHIPHLKVHIFRALDDAVFKLDWLIRTTRTNLDPTNPRHRDFFPDSLTGSRQAAAATELNMINDLADYAGLSNDAQTILAYLPGNEGNAWENGLQERDWVIRRTRASLRADDTEYFPDDWNKPPDDLEKQLRRRHVADTLNSLVSILSGSSATVAEKLVTLDGTPDLTLVRPYRDMLWLAKDAAHVPPPMNPDDPPQRDQFYQIIAADPVSYTVTIDVDDGPYLSDPSTSTAWFLYLNEHQTLEGDARALTSDALRVLAGLPGNDGAFTQVTSKPLDPSDPEYANKRGPDNPPGFHIDASLRAYVDTLDGRSTNRYFYRSAYVDGAHNRSEELSLSSPPVYLPNVVPPRTPVITKILGGDRKITLRWASNREPDLKEYRIYRTDQKEKARDIRLMEELIPPINVPHEDPAARPAEVRCTDDIVQGLVNYYYRVVAVDEAGNMSVPSPLVVGRAFDDSRPSHPAWDPVTAGPAANSVILSWTAPALDLRCLVQRRAVGANAWESASPWLSRGTYRYTDQNRTPNVRYEYRLRVQDKRGRQNNVYNVLTA